MGFYDNAGTPAAPSWARLSTGPASAGSGWSLRGNAATDSAARYLGTTAATPLRLHPNGAFWLGGVPVGSSALPNNHLLIGYQAKKPADQCSHFTEDKKGAFCNSNNMLASSLWQAGCRDCQPATTAVK